MCVAQEIGRLEWMTGWERGQEFDGQGKEVNSCNLSHTHFRAVRPPSLSVRTTPQDVLLSCAVEILDCNQCSGIQWKPSKLGCRRISWLYCQKTSGSNIEYRGQSFYVETGR
jgi:hypothetical protein